MPAGEATGGPRRHLTVAACLVGLAWIVAVGAAPLIAARGHSAPGWQRTPAAFVYLGASIICHQRPERSYHLGGAPLPLCARCVGLHLGTVVGLLAAAVIPSRLARRLNPRVRLAIALAGAPTAVSLGLEWLGGGSSLLSRTLTALPAGMVAGALVGLVIAGTSAMTSGRPRSAAATPSATLP